MSACRTLSRIPVSRIEVEPCRPRQEVSEASVARLAESIRLHGLLSPLLVRALGGGRYRLVAGARRLAALKLLGREWAQALVLDGDDCDCALIALVENLQREELHYLDVAMACRRILDAYPITQERLAAGLSCSPSALNNRLRLLKLPARVQAAARELKLSERHARALLGLADEADQLALAGLCAQKRLSVKQLEAAVAARRAPEKKKPPAPCLGVRDNRIVINALMDTVRKLTRIGVPVTSRVEQGDGCVNVIVTIPGAKPDGTAATA